MLALSLINPNWTIFWIRQRTKRKAVTLYLILTVVDILLLIILASFLPQTQITKSSAPSTQNSEVTVKISEIAGKTPPQITQMSGSPTSTKTVNPSRTPCPCSKYTYSNGAIEIVFIEGVADWITVNLPAYQVDTSGSYSSVDQF